MARVRSRVQTRNRHRKIFEITKGTDAPDAPSAVRRITHYVWSQQVKSEKK